MMKKTNKRVRTGAADNKFTRPANAAHVLSSTRSQLSADWKPTLTSLEHPSDELLARIGSIPILFEPPSGNHSVGARLAYDSWAEGAGVGLRDVVDGYIRRLKFKAGTITLELVAERRRNRWEFVGRAYSRDAVVHDFVLMVGRRKLLPGSGGFFHWTSEGLMRNLMLVSPDKKIAFEGVPW
jgi:hypothetical protein